MRQLSGLFIASLSINFFWENLHCFLYTTCTAQSLGGRIILLLIASLKDAFWVTVFYLITVYLFKNKDILKNIKQVLFFILLCFAFAFADEKISLYYGRWDYSPLMPLVFGVGLSPLMELAATGALSFMILNKMKNLRF
jgi:hypothetical protein